MDSINTDMDKQNNQINQNSSRYTNKDTGKIFALIGYIVLALGVIAAILLVIFLG